MILNFLCLPTLIIHMISRIKRQRNLIFTRMISTWNIYSFIQQPKLFSHFDWFSPKIYYRTDTRLTSSPQSFCFCILKWQKVLRNKIIFTWLAEDKAQNPLVEALNRYERQEEVRRSRFFCRKWLRKNTRAVSVGSWARLNQTQNWSCLPQVLSTPAVFKTTSELFGSQGCSDDKNLPWFFQHFL